MPGSDQSAIFLTQCKVKMGGWAIQIFRPVIPTGIMQAPLENLAGIFPRQLGSDFHMLGNLVVGK
jgi:hypothetical protein